MAIKKSVAEGFARGELYDIVKWQDGAPYGVTFTLGANDGQNGTRILSVQLTDYLNQSLSNKASVLAYVSSEAGDIASALGASVTGIAADTNGTLTALVAKQVFLLATNASGRVDIKFTVSATVNDICIAIVLANNAVITSGKFNVTKS